MIGLERGIRNVVEGAMDGAYHREQVDTAVRQLLDIVEGVRADARAAGFKEGVEAAANVAEGRKQQRREQAEKAGWEMAPMAWGEHAAVEDVLDDIRSIAPSGDKDEP